MIGSNSSFSHGRRCCKVKKMSMIVELDENGELHLPPTMLPGATPHARYQVEVRERQVVISPENGGEFFWQKANPRERAADILQWAASHRHGPGLPDEAVNRENIYD
jgi:hypothetical protein